VTTTTGPTGPTDPTGPAWDDGLIARRQRGENGAEATDGAMDGAAYEGRGETPYDGPYDDRYEEQRAAARDREQTFGGPGLRRRLEGLRELVGLSRARLDTRTLAQAGRVLDEAAARQMLSARHTVVAVAGATGSGKSTLFNALAGYTISEAGVRRPTTAAPIACVWSDGAAGLLDRIGIPGWLRRKPYGGGEPDLDLAGLVLIDLPDHDSAMTRNREQVDQVLGLVDAVIWVVDPEKYADAVLHERYLRPLAGHAEVMTVVLNQVDRLPGDAAHQVLDDLRRLLDEGGIALGEHGEPGAAVLALSALTGEGVDELRDLLRQFVRENGAPARRLAADVDGAARRLRPVYVAQGHFGLGEDAREEFTDRLAEAVGASAAGQAAEREWMRNAGKACGTPLLHLLRRREAWREAARSGDAGSASASAQMGERVAARRVVEQAVRTVADRAAYGLPRLWALAVREAAQRGAKGLPEALDGLAVQVAAAPRKRPVRPGWWPLAVVAQSLLTLTQVYGGLWLLGQILRLLEPDLWPPVIYMIVGIVGGPIVEWACRVAARGPARRYGLEAERRLREAAAGCGRARVLDPVAAELLRYREVREQYVAVSKLSTTRQ
jgi:energy-coupling factor transporter ATP-binding protein EcfA2